ncbi:MAG: transcriptional regulator TrmB [Candidatus Peregrinibacteria bacterium Greene0416_62]|nr:MAG: transcriptional regulator TrmB [Candidatus Peregrinibacteria bacterium Greene0416_62]TSD00761.1 MAG: transcriptional regulator TrmB [Candidatus Peregrinibacteria bacterium Greene1014_49]
MSTQLFEDLGLSMNEAKIYDALITYGGSGVSTIALRSSVHRSNAYDSLHRLIKKGLVYEVFSQKETIYEAVDPGKLLEFVEEKQAKVQAALPSLLSQFQQHRSPERAYIFKGIEGVKNYLREALKVGENIYSFGAKGAWFDPRLETFVRWFLKEAKRNKIQYHHIFDHEVREKLPHVLKAVGKPYKFLPKEYATDSTMDVFGDHVVTFHGLELAKLRDDITIFVMVSPGLAESYRAWWKLVWDLLPEAKNRRGK